MKNYNKNSFAITPPLGWNSYDYYDTAVNENQIKANADFMAAHMKDSGWEYIVVDIEWYAHDAGTQRDTHQYIPFWPVSMDEYSRLTPCTERFPSAANNMGFKPLADYIHNLGLKFGIHIMRGIPREAAHRHTSILGTDTTANVIADPSNICSWNPDMYGVRTDLPESQLYYDSLLALYAEWGVDFIKCDDICRMDMPSAKAEIAMLSLAIERCKRDIVLSLSPGPALINEAWYYEKHANMWRITDDFWDNYDSLLNMFNRCEIWQNHVSEGCFPDCDMLPVGMLGKGFGDERPTNFTYNEQLTMMTLWCIFRSPLMIGGELTLLDERTLAMLNNKEVMNLTKCHEPSKQYQRDALHAVWYTTDTQNHFCYLAIFNFTDDERNFSVDIQKIFNNALDEINRTCNTYIYENITELWTGDSLEGIDVISDLKIPSHGAKLYKIIYL